MGPFLCAHRISSADFSLPGWTLPGPKSPPDLPYPSLSAQEEKELSSSLFDSSSPQESAGTFHQKPLPTKSTPGRPRI